MWLLAVATRKHNDAQIVLLLSIRAPHRPCLLALTLALALAVTCCPVSVRRKALAAHSPARACEAWYKTAPTAAQQHSSTAPTAAYRRTPPHAATRRRTPPHTAAHRRPQ